MSVCGLPNGPARPSGANLTADHLERKKEAYTIHCKN